MVSWPIALGPVERQCIMVGAHGGEVLKERQEGARQ